MGRAVPARVQIAVQRLSLDVRGYDGNELPAPEHAHMTRLRTARLGGDQPPMSMIAPARERVPPRTTDGSRTADHAEGRGRSRQRHGAHREAPSAAPTPAAFCRISPRLKPLHE